MTHAPPMFVLLTYLTWGPLVIFVVWLLLSPRFRSWFKQHKLLSIALVLGVPQVLGLLAATVMLLRPLYRAPAPEADRHVTLAEDTKIGEFDFPAGTRLDLREAYVYESYNIEKAIFPHPVAICGIASTALSSLSDYFEIIPAADETIDGWHCQGGQPVRFTTRDRDFRTRDRNYNYKPVAPYLSRCVLAAGNKAGTISIPPGSTMGESAVFSEAHPHSIDIGIFDEIIFGDLHAPLKRVCLTVNGAARELLSVHEAILARPLRIGAATVPAGSGVSWYPGGNDPMHWSDNKENLYAGSWHFSIWEIKWHSGDATGDPCSRWP